MQEIEREKEAGAYSAFLAMRYLRSLIGRSRGRTEAVKARGDGSGPGFDGTKGGYPGTVDTLPLFWTLFMYINYFSNITNPCVPLAWSESASLFGNSLKLTSSHARRL